MSDQRNGPEAALEGLSDDVRDALASVLADDESLSMVVEAVGCTLVLTDRQVVVVREGAAYRPRSGVRAWPIDAGLAVRRSAVTHGTGRVVIGEGPDATSVFVRSDHWDDAEALVALVRRRTTQRISRIG